MSVFDYYQNKGEDNSKAMSIVRKRAEEANWKIKKDDNNLIVLGFHDELGTEDIFIKVCGKSDEGDTVLEFSSMGLPLPDEIGSAALFGLTLLERNGSMLMGHWGIEDMNGEKYFTVFHSMLAEDMDVGEFKGAVMAVLKEKKRILLEFNEHKKKAETENTNQPKHDLNFEFKSSDHLRYENGKHTSGPHGGANRMVKVENNIENGEGYTVTLYNLDGDHPVWQNNIQMAPKQMKIKNQTENRVDLIGYGYDQMGASFSDYGLTIEFKNDNVNKCVLHMFDRNVDIEYLQ